MRGLRAHCPLLAAVVVVLALPACRGEDRAAAVTAVGAHDIAVTIDRKLRSYRLFVPRTASRHPLPLVLVLHGYGQSGKLLEPATGYDKLADEQGFLVAYPDAIHGVWNTRLPSGFKSSLADDVRFLTQLVDEIARRHKVDRRRVYATGHSDGARMTYRLACEHPEVFAAVAPVAGGMTLVCHPTRAVSVLQVEGGDDELTGAEAAAAVKTMRRLDGCPGRPISAEGGASTLQRFAPCRSGTQVWSAVVPGVGHHIWPRAADGFDTTAQSWMFLSQFTLP